MSEDLTNKLLQSTDEKLTLVLTLVQSLTARDNNIDLRLNNIDSRLDKLDSRLETIHSRVVHVEQRVNDVGPVLQKLSINVEQLQEGQLQLQTTVLQLQDGQRQLQEGQEIIAGELHTLRRDVSHRFLALSGAANAEIKNLKERVTRLEQNLNPPKPET